MHVAGTRRAAEAETIDLEATRLEGGDPGAFLAEETVQVNQDFDLQPADKLGDFAVRAAVHIVKRVEGTHHALPHLTFVVKAGRDRVQLEAAFVVTLE